LTSSPSAQQALHTYTGKVSLEEEWKYDRKKVRRNYRKAAQPLDVTEN
jgi:hypothetical protein